MEMPSRTVPLNDDLEKGRKNDSSYFQDVTTTSLSSDDFNGLIRNNPVMVFSKSTCAFCLELKRTLSYHGIFYATFEVDMAVNRAEIIDMLNEKSGFRTFPNVFVNGKSIGGCMDCKRMEHEGTLLEAFATVPRVAKQPEERVHRTTLFFFPETVNRRAAQMSGILSFIVCVLCVGFWERKGTRWVVLALAIDFFGRIIGGGPWTPIGMLSSVLTSGMDPVLSAGAPKQFAAFCGFFMSCLSAGLLLGGEQLGGTIVIGILIFPTGLEGFFDFCLGCWMFGWGITFGIIPKSIYRPYLNMYMDKDWAYKFTHEARDYPEAPRVHVLRPGQTTETAVDLIRKDRFETEYKLQDSHLVKHARVELFGWPMALIALAFVFRNTSDSYIYGTQQLGNWGTKRVAHAFGITAAILFIFFGILYLARTFLYCKKVVKEWRHPINGNMFSAINICLTLFGVLMYREDLNFGIALVWIASCFQMFITVEKVASLMFSPFADELLNPSIMMSPVSNFVCAIAFSQYQREPFVRNYEGAINYLNLSRLWFAVAALFAVVMFTITFAKSIRDHHSDSRLRPTLFIWLATCSVAGPSYASVAHDFGLFYQCMWLLAVFFFAVNIFGYLKGFYSYVQDMSIFIYSFSYCAFALSTFQYYVYVGQDQFSRVLAIIALAIACSSVCVSSLYAVLWTLDSVMFRPKPKWGPVNFMKLTHEAFRFALPKLVARLNAFGDNVSKDALEEFIVEFNAMLTTYVEHGNHEEKVLFPAVSRYFPGFANHANDEHEAQHAVVDSMKAAISTWYESPNAVASLTLINSLKSDFPKWAQNVLDHLRGEEAGISVVARKYFTLDLQKQLTNEVFSLTSAENWEVIMPFVIKSLGMPMWKSQFVRTFIWANPSRAQEIGLILYRGLDSCTYAALKEEIPEITPRGDCGHIRAY